MDDLGVAHRLGDIADRITDAAYRPGRTTAHDVKEDGSPVTDHDRDVEEALREALTDLRPDDAVLGEEIGPRGRSHRRWVIDGIDGTVNFIVGDPRWSTQIALMDGDQPIVGLSTSPAQGRRWWASATTPARTAALGAGGLDVTDDLQVTSVGNVSGARVTSIPPRDRLTDDQGALLAQVFGDARYVEPTTHGAKMVAAGHVDACLQLRGQLWDYAALTVIVEQAGGAVTSLTGPRRSLDHGGPLLFTNGRLHP